MTSCLRFLTQRLMLLLAVGLSLVSAGPCFAQFADVANLAEQTDADYEPEQIEKLIGLVKSAQGWDRASAFWNLEALGPEARRAIPILIDFLEDQSMMAAQVRVNDSASLALAYLGAEAVAPLVEAFPQASPEAKRLVAQTAAQLGPDARELVPAFRKEYVSAKPDERWPYLWALACIDTTGETAFPSILIALRNAEDESERRLAAQCLRIEGSPEYSECPSQARQWFQQRQQNPELAVNALLQALRDKEPGVRGAAIESLGGYTRYEKQIVPELIRMLDDDAQYSVMISIDLGGVECVSNVAANALTDFAASAEKSVPAVVTWALREGPVFKSNPEQQFADLIPSSHEPFRHIQQLLESHQPELALLTIARMGKAAQALIPQVETLTKGENKDIALRARLTLACIDSRYQAEALKQLNRQFLRLRDDVTGDEEEEFFWNHAFFFLIQVGENASFAKPIFETILTSQATTNLDIEFHRVGAAGFLGDIGAGSSESVRVMLSLIEQESWSTTESITDLEVTLVRMCPGIVPDLNGRLGNGSLSEKKKIAILHVLAAAHAEDPQLVPLVISQLKSNHPDVRESAVEALGEIGTKNEQSVRALTGVLGDPRVLVRAKALDSLAKLEDMSKPAIPQIIKCLSDDYLTVRVAAVRCLGTIGKTARSAIDELEKLKNCESLLLRETAAEALEKIRS